MEPSDVRPLSRLKINESGVVIALTGGQRFVSRLVGLGLNVGSRVQVAQPAGGGGGPMLVVTGGARLAIGRGMADKVAVSVDQQECVSGATEQAGNAAGPSGTKIKDMEVGHEAAVVGYTPASDRAYCQKLLRMGLVRGAQFTLIRNAPLGDPVEIALKGFNLTLRAHEADVLNVKRIG